jgi:hypothetical protein
MRKVFLTVLLIFVLCGCDREESFFPKRPKEVPCYYNETTLTEMDQNARYTLRRARERTGIEFVTVILRSIPRGIEIGDYAAGLFHAWRIGSKTNGKGVLLLFIADTHTLKIEVGYELEGIFPDAYCNSFQPTIKAYYAGRYFGDVFCNLVENLERRILVEDYSASNTRPWDLSGDPELFMSSEAFLSGGGGIVDDEYYYDSDTKLAFIRNISSQKIREFDSDKDINVVINRYFKSLEQGINYPFLGILTEGSQMKRLEYPHSSHFYRSRWDDCRRALPYKIKYKGDLAALRFAKEQSFPIFLRRTTEGFWKIDAAWAWVCSWQDFSANESGPIHKDHPWMFAFSEVKRRKSLCKVPEPYSVSKSLKDEIARLEAAIEKNPGNAANYFEFGDLFYWNCLWIAPAINLVERGLMLEPSNESYRWLVIYMRNRFPSPEPNAKHFEKLLEINPENRQALYYYSWHNWYFTIDYKKSMEIMKKIKKLDKKLGYGEWAYRIRIDEYKENFWKQLVVDRNIFWKVWNYLYIFYLSVLYVIGVLVFLSVLLFLVIWKFKYKPQVDIDTIS